VELIDQTNRPLTSLLPLISDGQPDLWSTNLMPFPGKRIFDYECAVVDGIAGHDGRRWDYLCAV